MMILASASPRRRHLLKKAGIRFRIIPSHVSEKIPRGMKPPAIVTSLAKKKALSIAKKFPRAVVLGADTLVYVNKHIVGKPKNVKDARRILRELSGAWQKVYTGVSVVWGGGQYIKSGVVVSRVKFRKLNREEIEFHSKNHLDKAGAYAIQEKGDRFVERLVGDYDNVVGLPMKLTRKLLAVSRGRAR